jgi:hydroxymethylglutaryl-CoA reductase
MTYQLQDISRVVESQAGVTFLDLIETEEDSSGPSLYVSLTLPSLLVSMPSLWGYSGTNLPSQKANVDLIGAETPEELACVLAASLLGGELGYYAAISTHYSHNVRAGKISVRTGKILEEEEYKEPYDIGV